jgi:hypothetical protein
MLPVDHLDEEIASPIGVIAIGTIGVGRARRTGHQRRLVADRRLDASPFGVSDILTRVVAQAGNIGRCRVRVAYPRLEASPIGVITIGTIALR